MSQTNYLMWLDLELLSSRTTADISALRDGVARGAVHPKTAKVDLAREIVARFHDHAAARRAAADFERRFAKRDLDAVDLPVVEITLDGPTGLVTRVVATAGLARSATEARKLIAQGGVRVDREKVGDPMAALGPGEYLVQVGKLRAARIVLRSR